MAALIFMVDRTGSMGCWWQQLNVLLAPMLTSFALTGVFDDMAVISYSDYDLPAVEDVVKFSGLHNCASTAGVQALRDFTTNVQLEGGGNWREAVKTCLATLCKHVLAQQQRRGSVYSLVHVVHLTDAPEHHDKFPDTEGLKERARLKELFNWPVLCDRIRSRLPHLHFNCITTLQVDHFGENLACLASDTGGKFVTVPTEEDCTAALSNLMHTWLEQPGLVKDRMQHCFMQLKDAAFYDHAFDEMHAIVSTNPVCLTVAPFLGRLWRQLCGMRSDPRRQSLLAAMSGAKGTLNPVEQVLVDSFLQASYINADDVDEALSTYFQAHPGSSGQVVFTPEDDRHWECCTIVQLLSGASARSKGLPLLRGILARFTVDRAAPATQVPNSLPLQWDKLIPHLLHCVSPGTVLSTRLAAVLAMHIVDCNSVLQDVAVQYLDRVRGTWLNWGYHGCTPQVPENFQAPFLNLLARIPAAATEAELAVVKRLLAVHNMCSAVTTQLNVTVVKRNSDVGYFPSHVRRCSRCTNLRPLSLIANDEGVCAYCVLGETGGYVVTDPNRVFQVCCKQCGALYARQPCPQATQRGFRNKCHACRNGQKPPTWQCLACKKHYVRYYKAMTSAQCAACTAKTSAGQVEDVMEMPLAAHQLFDTVALWPYLASLHGFKLKPGVTLGTREGVPRVAKALQLKINAVSVERPELRQWTVVNVAAVWQQVMTMCLEGKPPTSECSLCLTEALPKDLTPCCGRSGCHQRVCGACLVGWYGRNKVGHLLYERALKCQFCARRPTRKVLKAAAPQLLALPEFTIVPGMQYAWCTWCGQGKEYGERACIAQSAPTAQSATEAEAVTAFQCTDCRALVTKGELKHCPHCKVMVQKDGGCNHMSCVCGWHWCWECAKFVAKESGPVYDHMVEKHGRIFDTGLLSNDEDM